MLSYGDAEELTDDQSPMLCLPTGLRRWKPRPSSRRELPWIHFDREASSLEDAIRLAIQQVRLCRLPKFSKIELDSGSASFHGAISKLELRKGCVSGFAHLSFLAAFFACDLMRHLDV